MMTTPTHRERLLRLIRHSIPYRREVGGSPYLIACFLLLMVGILAAVAVIGGFAASEIFRSYTDRLSELLNSHARGQ